MGEWNVLAGARQDFADMLDELSEEQLQAPEVHGTGEALLMALHNRDVSAELDGEGVTLLG